MTLRPGTPRRERPRGAALVLVAVWLAVAVLAMALVIEVGMLVTQRLQLQRAADLAALGGAAALPEHPGLAIANARLLARANGARDPEIAVMVDNNHVRLTVIIVRPYTPLFAPLLRRASVTLRAQAEALVVPLQAFRGVVPWGVEQQPFLYEVEYVLKHGADDSDLPRRGNFRILNLTGSDTPWDYQRWVAHDYDAHTIRVGDRIPVQTGNLGSHTSSGLEERRRLSTGYDCTWPRPEFHCPLIVMVPVVTYDEDPGGRMTAKVVGFARFWVSGVSTSPHEVRGMFLSRIELEGEPGGPNDFGARRILLVR